MEERFLVKLHLYFFDNNTHLLHRYLGCTDYIKGWLSYTEDFQSSARVGHFWRWFVSRVLSTAGVLSSSF